MSNTRNRKKTDNSQVIDPVQLSQELELAQTELLHLKQAYSKLEIDLGILQEKRKADLLVINGQAETIDKLNAQIEKSHASTDGDYDKIIEAHKSEIIELETQVESVTRRLKMSKAKVVDLQDKVAALLGHDGNGELEPVGQEWVQRENLEECENLGELIACLLGHYDLETQVTSFQKSILRSQLSNARK